MIVSIPCAGHSFELEIADEVIPILRGKIQGVVCPTCAAMLAVDSAAYLTGTVASGDVSVDATTTGAASPPLVIP